MQIDLELAATVAAVADEGTLDAASRRLQITPSAVSQRLKALEQQLTPPTPDDNRITFGCINIAPAFYQDLVRPAFSGTGGVVYILPETMSLSEALPAFRAPTTTASAQSR